MTNLDRDWWSYAACDLGCGRKRQLSIDTRWWDHKGGQYEHFCWQCYWAFGRWRDGPIINCGPMWDEIDERRRHEGHPLEVKKLREHSGSGDAG